MRRGRLEFPATGTHVSSSLPTMYATSPPSEWPVTVTFIDEGTDSSPGMPPPSRASMMRLYLRFTSRSLRLNHLTRLLLELKAPRRMRRSSRMSSGSVGSVPRTAKTTCR